VYASPFSPPITYSYDFGKAPRSLYDFFSPVLRRPTNKPFIPLTGSFEQTLMVQSLLDFEVPLVPPYLYS